MTTHTLDMLNVFADTGAVHYGQTGYWASFTTVRMHKSVRKLCTRMFDAQICDFRNFLCLNLLVL